MVAIFGGAAAHRPATATPVTSTRVFRRARRAGRAVLSMLWNEHFQARIRVIGLLLGQLATPPAGCRPMSAGRCWTASPELLAAVEGVQQRVRKRKRPFGPEGLAWVARVARRAPPAALAGRRRRRRRRTSWSRAWERGRGRLRGDGQRLRDRPVAGPARCRAARRRPRRRGRSAGSRRRARPRPGSVPGRCWPSCGQVSGRAREARDARSDGAADADRPREGDPGAGRRGPQQRRDRAASCSSAPRPSACTCPTSWPSSAPPAAPRPRRSPGGDGLLG